MTSDFSCKALTKSGNPCKLQADSSGFCHIHNPDKIAQRETKKQAINAIEFMMPDRRFSERSGYRPVSLILQIESMSPELRNSLWNVLVSTFLLEYRNALYATTYSSYYGHSIDQFFSYLWTDYFKWRLDTLPDQSIHAVDQIRKHFFECEWYEVYDFLEIVVNYFESPPLVEKINIVLERELAGYRFVGGIFTQITDEKEIALLEQEINDKDYPFGALHLKHALSLMSNKEKPDYRNSIKESISAVESIAKEITGNPKATLGEALKLLKHSGQLHPALANSFLSLYGYTSDENGIRHAMLGEPGLTVADAKFFLLSCTSFINYLKVKMQ